MTSKEEKWAIIEEYPNYMVSTLGNVKSIKTNKILKPYINKKGYAYICLSYKTKTGYMFRFRPSKNEDINKTFKTKEQAIEYRNNYFKEHKEYVIE